MREPADHAEYQLQIRDEQIDDLQNQLAEKDAEIARLKAELKKSEQRECSYSPLDDCCTNKQEENERLREGLRIHGSHLGGCAEPFSNGELRCDCGLAALIKGEK